MLHRFFGILALGILIQPLLQAYSLTLAEYVRLLVIVIGLGVMYRRDWGDGRSLSERAWRRWQILLALIFMFLVTQFDPIKQANVATDWMVIFSVVPLACLFLASALVLYVDRSGLRSFASFDWIVIAIFAFVTTLVVGTRILSDTAVSWWFLLKLSVYLVSWFVFTRLVLPNFGFLKKAIQILIAVFLIVCLIGCVRTGLLFYYFHSAKSSVLGHRSNEAFTQYASVARSGRALNLPGFTDASVFAQAQIMFSRGDSLAAAKLLGLSNDFSKVIDAELWIGPAGGELYTNISCWRDLDLYAGQVEVRIFARGQAALNEWPRMKVMLGDHLLGEVSVHSTELQPYIFQTKTETGVQRLEISFLNDYYDLPEDRNLWVEDAEVQYKGFSWK